jgi:hypothetical protein
MGGAKFSCGELSMGRVTYVPIGWANCSGVSYGASYQWGELPMEQIVLGVSCLWGELSMGGAKFPWGELSMGIVT